MTAPAVLSPGLTVEAIASALPLPYRFRHTSRSRSRYVAAILRDEQRRGHVREGEDGRWTLTEFAEREYGDALRDLVD